MPLSRVPPPDLFRERLRAVREQRGFSQDELAKRAGLQASAVSHFETGTRKPSFDNLRRLADALEITTDYLVGRAKEPTGHAAPTQMFKNYELLTDADRKAIDNLVGELAKKGELRREKAGTDRLTVKKEPDGWRHYAGSWPIHCGEAIELATLGGGFIAGRFELQHVQDGPPRAMFHVGLAGGRELAVAIPDNAEVRVPGKPSTPQ